MEYCCHLWAGAPSCYLELPDKLQKQMCSTVGQNVASLSLFYRYYFGRCSSELAELVPLPYSQGRSTSYSDRLHDLSLSPFLDVTRISVLTVSFLAQLDSGILCL